MSFYRVVGLLLWGCCWAGLVAGQTISIRRPAAPGVWGAYYAGAPRDQLVYTRADAALNFDWTAREPGPNLPAAFSVRWTGWVLAPASGRYTFVRSPGLRVWIGGHPLLSTPTATLPLVAGRYYSLRAEYEASSTSRRVLLSWQLPTATAATPLGGPYLVRELPPTAVPLGPALPAQRAGSTIATVMPPQPTTAPDVPAVPGKGTVVPNAPPTGQGLQASYYAGPPTGPVVLRRIEPVVDATWRGQAPAPGVPGQGFSVRWTGYLRAPETGVYILHTQWDDATDVRFAGENVLAMTKYEPDFFGPPGPPIPLDVVQYYEAGKFYQIDLAYKDVQGVSRAVLSWVRPSEIGFPTRINQAFVAAGGHRLAVVPQQYLYAELPRPVPTVARVPVAASKPVAVAARRPASPPLPTRRARPAAPHPVAARPPAPAPLLPNLAALRPGTAVALPNLYFTQSTADLLPASRPVLTALLGELRGHSALRLELAGHTDNVGDAARNLRLSQQRAQVVRRYLLQQGIDSVRLRARGYGGTRPVADNRDPRQRPRNRRVEAVVQ